jgi:hypothetical protein
MMSKLGYRAGQALGAAGNPHARLEPIGVEVKEGRSGIGLDSERKRKVREEFEGAEKRVKESEEGYRERVGREREEKRLTGLLGGAMRVAEGLEEGGGEGEGEGREDPLTGKMGAGAKRKGEMYKPLKEVNVLWRGLVRERIVREQERRARYDMLQSLSRNTTYDDPDEDEHDRQAWAKTEEDVEQQDDELDAFDALEAGERLKRVVGYLRQRLRYCFWCKMKYADEQMEGCPGETDDDHD